MRSRQLKKRIWVVWSAGMMLFHLTGLREQCWALVKYHAVDYLPLAVIGPVLGWDAGQVHFESIYFRDGLVRAREGRGFK